MELLQVLAAGQGRLGQLGDLHRALRAALQQRHVLHARVLTMPD